MKKRIVHLIVLTMMFSASISAQTFYRVYDRYIANFSDIAIATMQQYNVPASILLAQGMLESVGGTNTLAAQANNHFAIRCQDWDGATFMHRPNEFSLEEECFRRYSTIAESFADQAKILKFNPRYRVLSQYTPDNYQAWARGLQYAGYATSPEYADRLIQLIRYYKLHRFDQQALTQRESNNRREQQALNRQARNEQRAVREGRNAQARTERTERDAQARSEQEARRVDRQANIVAETAVSAPRIPEQPVVVNQNFSVGETRLIRQHDVDRVNGVRFIVAQEGDTHFSLARKFGLTLRDIRRFNDLPLDVEVGLKRGDLVFLQAKRTVAARGYGFHQVQEGESMHSIAQMYAIRLTNLYNMNKMRSNEQLTVGRILRLR